MANKKTTSQPPNVNPILWPTESLPAKRIKEPCTKRSPDIKFWWGKSVFDPHWKKPPFDLLFYDAIVPIIWSKGNEEGLSFQKIYGEFTNIHMLYVPINVTD